MINLSVMPPIKLRWKQLMIGAIALTMVVPLGALADTHVERDPDDSMGRLDVKVVRHGHTLTGDLKHVIVTRETWTKRQFDRKGSIRFLFSYYGDSCADAWVLIDVHRGDLRARWQGYDPLGCPKGDDDGGFSDFYGDVTVRKPSKDRLVLVVPRELFPVRADDYRWAVTTVWTDCKDPCGDNAPDRADADRTKIRHDL